MKLLATSFILALPLLGQATPVVYSVTEPNGMPILVLNAPDYLPNLVGTDWSPTGNAIHVCGFATTDISCIGVTFEQITNGTGWFGTPNFTGVYFSVSAYSNILQGPSGYIIEQWFSGATLGAPGVYTSANSGNTVQFSVEPAPEPSTISFVGFTLIGLAYVLRKRYLVRNSPVG